MRSFTRVWTGLEIACSVSVWLVASCSPNPNVRRFGRGTWRHRRSCERLESFDNDHEVPSTKKHRRPTTGVSAPWLERNGSMPPGHRSIPRPGRPPHANGPFRRAKRAVAGRWSADRGAASGHQIAGSGEVAVRPGRDDVTQFLNHPPQVMIRGVQRNRRQPDHVWRPEIGHDATRQATIDSTHICFNA